MGLDANSVQFLIAARKQGVQFGRTMMLGRQHFFVPPASVREYLEHCALPATGVEEAIQSSPFSEPFFKALGGTQIDSLDNATFEGANFIHDLNQPIPDEMERKIRHRLRRRHDGTRV